MAKPGSNAARQMAGRAVDLARAKMSDTEVAEIQEGLELSNGLRCGGCGRRIGAGFKFVSLAPKERAPVLMLSACSREDCDYAMRCKEGGTYMEIAEYVWLDELGVDAPPAKVVQLRLEKKAAQAVRDEEAMRQRDSRESRAAEGT